MAASVFCEQLTYVPNTQEQGHNLASYSSLTVIMLSLFFIQSTRDSMRKGSHSGSQTEINKLKKDPPVSTCTFLTTQFSGQGEMKTYLRTPDRFSFVSQPKILCGLQAGGNDMGTYSHNTVRHVLHSSARWVKLDTLPSYGFIFILQNHILTFFFQND